MSSSGWGACSCLLYIIITIIIITITVMVIIMKKKQKMTSERWVAENRSLKTKANKTSQKKQTMAKEIKERHAVCSALLFTVCKQLGDIGDAGLKAIVVG